MDVGIACDTTTHIDGALTTTNTVAAVNRSKKKSGTRRNAWGNQSYADLITQAILASSDSRLTLAQIYEWMTQNVTYFRGKADSNSSAGWKNSIRHNLSLHNKFIRLQNEGTGKSSWWTLNPSAKPGKATRRRATSMDTKMFEKRRGRVKKRLELTRTAGGGLVPPPSNHNTADSSSKDSPPLTNISSTASESTLYPARDAPVAPLPPTTTTTSRSHTVTPHSTSISSSFRQRSGSSASNCSRSDSSPLTNGHAKHQQQHARNNSSASSATPFNGDVHENMMTSSSSCQAAWDQPHYQYHANNRYDPYHNDHYLTQSLAGTMKIGGSPPAKPNPTLLTDLHSPSTARPAHPSYHHHDQQQQRGSSFSNGGGAIDYHQHHQHFTTHQQHQHRHNSISGATPAAISFSHLNLRHTPHYNSSAALVSSSSSSSSPAQPAPSSAVLPSLPYQQERLRSRVQSEMSPDTNNSSAAWQTSVGSVADKLRATLAKNLQQQQQAQNSPYQHLYHHSFGGGIVVPHNRSSDMHAGQFNNNNNNRLQPLLDVRSSCRMQQQQHSSSIDGFTCSPLSNSVTATPGLHVPPSSAGGGAGNLATGRHSYPHSAASPSQFYTMAGAPSSTLMPTSLFISSSAPSGTYLPADLQSIDIQPLGMFDEHMQFMQNDLRDGDLNDFNFAGNSTNALSNAARI